MPQEMKRYAALLDTSPTLMRKKRNRNNVCITEEILDLCDERRTIQPNRDKSIQGKRAYCSITCIYRSKISIDPSEMSDTNVQHNLEIRNAREAFDIVHCFTQTKTGRTGKIKSVNGTKLSKKCGRNTVRRCSAMASMSTSSRGAVQ